MVLAPLRLRCCDIKIDPGFFGIESRQVTTVGSFFNPSSQSSKHQDPSRSVCCLELDVSLELGAWCLELSTNYLPRCSGKSARMLSSVASQTPRSVMSPVTNLRGVTSNPKFAAGLCSGVTRTSTCAPP